MCCELEIERLCYTLENLLLTRLEKLERHFAYYDDGHREGLSVLELDYLDRFIENLRTALNASAFEGVKDKQVTRFPTERDVYPPHLSGHVFFRALVSLGPVRLDVDTSTLVEADDIFLAPFDTIRTHLLDGTIELL